MWWFTRKRDTYFEFEELQLENTRLRLQLKEAVAEIARGTSRYQQARDGYGQTLVDMWKRTEADLDRQRQQIAALEHQVAVCTCRLEQPIPDVVAE